MSSARPPGDSEQPPGPAAAADDPAVAAAVRIQRRRLAWAVAMVWFIGALLLCAGVLDGAALPRLLLVGLVAGDGAVPGVRGHGVPWAINGATYLAGAGQAVRWSGDIPIHGDGDAAGSLVIGLLFVFGGAMVVFYVYRRATRVWWPRYVQRRARAFGGG